MEKHYLTIFQGEVQRQCKFALIAFDDMGLSLGKNNDRFWYSIQAFLVATANVSKLLWPNPEYAERGEELRKSLDVPDGGPLKSRELRNAFEHFDERLETWMRQSKRHNFVDSCIGEKNLIKGVDTSDYMRWFSPSTYSLEFQGKKYELIPMMEAVQKLYLAARAANDPTANFPKPASMPTDQRPAVED